MNVIFSWQQEKEKVIPVSWTRCHHQKTEWAICVMQQYLEDKKHSQ